MSIEADISRAFDELVEKLPENEGEIRKCQFSVFEGLALDSYAGDVVQNMLFDGFETLVDDNMRCYIG